LTAFAEHELQARTNRGSIGNFGNKTTSLSNCGAIKYCSQKLNYIHNNPVEAGFVNEAIHWKYNSAKNYAGEVG